MSQADDVVISVRLVAGEESRHASRSWSFADVPRPGDEVVCDLWDSAAHVRQVTYDIGARADITIHLSDVTIASLEEILNHEKNGWRLSGPDDLGDAAAEYLIRRQGGT